MCPICERGGIEVLFSSSHRDETTIQDVATYQDPLRYSVGVKAVFVNGRPVVLDGKIAEERPGRALRGPGYKPVH